MADNKNNSGASTADAGASQAGNGFVSFPSREGVTHVRAETVDAIEACADHTCHLVIDGVRLHVSVSTLDAVKMLNLA